MYLTKTTSNKVIEITDEAQAARFQLNDMYRPSTKEEIAEYQVLQEQRAKRAASAAPVADRAIYYSSVRKSADGYGMSRDHLKKELFQQGVLLDENYNGQKVGLVYSYPYDVMQLETPIKLIYTMFESDKIPQDWPDYLRMANEVLVPSKWLRDVFERSGIKATVVPLGYNDRVFTFTDRPVPVENNQDFVFVHYNAFNLRKGFAQVLKAFTEEFAPTEPVKLLLKSTLPRSPIPLSKKELPNIEMIYGEVSEQELSKILDRAHCMVFPSKGEGFGLTPLEAMATGIPAIVPNAHGISEYFDPDICLGVKYQPCEALYSRFKGQDVGQMVECDVTDLRRQMRYAYNHQAEMKERGIRAAEYVKRWTYSRTAAQLAEILNRWQDAEIPKRVDTDILPVEVI